MINVEWGKLWIMGVNDLNPAWMTSVGQASAYLNLQLLLQKRRSGAVENKGTLVLPHQLFVVDWKTEFDKPNYWWLKSNAWPPSPREEGPSPPGWHGRTGVRWRDLILQLLLQKRRSVALENKWTLVLPHLLLLVDWKTEFNKLNYWWSKFNAWPPSPLERDRARPDDTVGRGWGL